VFFVFLFPLRPIFVLFFTRISTKADSGDDGSVACGVDVRWHQIRYHYHQVATYAKEAASSHFFRADRELLSRVAQKEQRGAKGQVLPRKIKKSAVIRRKGCCAHQCRHHAFQSVSQSVSQCGASGTQTFYRHHSPSLLAVDRRGLHLWLVGTAASRASAARGAS
jgi:hypothetical protein